MLSIFLSLVFVLSLTACVKKSNTDTPLPAPSPATFPNPSANQTGSVAAELQNQTAVAPPPPVLEPQPMKLCVRPAHRLGVKKCVRTGKWVRLTLASNDVDNDRTDVFSSPRISLKKENFYPDTFRFVDGVQPIGNYPDYYHINAAYGGVAHMEFVMPSFVSLAVTYGYAGRDEVKANLQRSFNTMTTALKEYTKIQHWNDGGTFKKFASIYFEIFADYSETNYRYTCGWMEQDQGYEYGQSRTKEGVEVPKIPETFIWRKIAQSCEQLSRQSAEGNFNYLPFRDISVDPISTAHKFTEKNRNKIKIYSFKSANAEEQESSLNTINPMSMEGMKTDGSTSLFLNNNQEEISRWESIDSEDLKDTSFQPERAK